MKVKSHYFGARLLKPTTDSRAALMLSPMTTTTVTGRRHAAPVVASASGLGMPIAAIFYPWLRACRVSLFLPANAMVPLAIGAMFFKVVDRLEQGHHVGSSTGRARPICMSSSSPIWSFMRAASGSSKRWKARRSNPD